MWACGTTAFPIGSRGLKHEGGQYRGCQAAAPGTAPPPFFHGRKPIRGSRVEGFCRPTPSPQALFSRRAPVATYAYLYVNPLVAVALGRVSCPLPIDMVMNMTKY